ncbi:MAG TPA: alpha/beta hydrolase, partial [Acetobacteraceae bacterium]
MTDYAALVARPGANDLPYADPHLPGREIILRSARPAQCTPETPVLFVHHGVLRNGADYRDYWLPLVDEAGILVIVPEFPNEGFPGSRWYNFGNRTDEAGALKPREQWTYAVDRRVFDGLREAGVTTRRRYGEWGHSAGGQFVHRMISLGFGQDAAVAVTANAGTYAMPVLEVDFPYGLGSTGTDEAGLRRLLAFRMTVMAGTEDVDTLSEHFPKEPAAMAQGGSRYLRAHSYIRQAREMAARLGCPCNWTIIDVPGVDHDGCRMSAAAAPIVAA